MNEKPLESWRARAAVSEALEVFNSTYMQEVWSKALARRETDPEGAVTSARTLLEAVCKHILDSSNKEFREGTPLPQLYMETAKLLEMAPSHNLAPVFNTMFTACVEVVAVIGKLRNELSDSHGRGQFGAMPEWRHAELAVNLSGAVVMYLAAVWKGRQPTVSNVIHAFLAKRPDLAHPNPYIFERLARDLNDIVATKLRASDLVTYFEERTARDKLSPLTIQKEFALLRVALGGISAAAVSEASDILKKKNVMTAVHVSRLRRVTHEEVDAVLAHLREQAPLSPGYKYPDAAEGVIDVIEFAIWSGRRLNEILQLRWVDVDFEKKTCKLPGEKESFPVFERAWELIEERRPKSFGQDAKLFPENRQAVSVRNRNAVIALAEAGKIQGSLRFHDYRHEAAYRLLEKGYPATVVARATGQPPARIHDIADDLNRKSPQ
jgi:integrase